MQLRASGEHYVLALLSGELAGRISTRNAGAISFSATLTWRSGEEMPDGLILGDPPPGARFYSLTNTEDPLLATRKISCQIRALYDEDLTAALDKALRYVNIHAALTEAMLETSIVRLAAPSVPPSALVEKLAWQLWSANLPVSFGPSWTPAPGADVSVGNRGAQEALKGFLQTHPTWQLLPQ